MIQHRYTYPICCKRGNGITKTNFHIIQYGSSNIKQRFIQTLRTLVVNCQSLLQSDKFYNALLPHRNADFMDIFLQLDCARLRFGNCENTGPLPPYPRPLD